MGFLSDLIDAPGRLICAAAGGHDYKRVRAYLVCRACGHRVRVDEDDDA